MAVFDLLGVLLGFYTIHAALTGSVYVRHRAWGRTILRDEESGRFWLAIAIYTALSIALVFYF